MKAQRSQSVRWMIPLIVAACLINVPAQAKYGGGAGTPDDPYQIWTPEQMNAIGAEPNDWDKHFKLMADIDLSAYTGERFNLIGSAKEPFRGVFDGDGRAVVSFHFTCEDRDAVGLFAHVSGDNAQIRNLRLADPNIHVTTGHQVGSVVGSLSGGTVVNCRVAGGSVCAEEDVGGLVGRLDPREETASIRDCCFAGQVLAKMCVGGLVGRTFGSIGTCCASGRVSGSEKVGGLVGSARWGSIHDCYAIVRISCERSGGGIIGENGTTVTNCYAAGSVTGTEGLGGLVGSGNDDVVGSFWDTETSGQTKSIGGTGLLTAQMQAAGTFSAWNACEAEPIWTIDEGKDYPRLLWEGRTGHVIKPVLLSHVLAGAGTKNDPYLIYTAEQLNAIGLYPCQWDRCFKLMNDIDLIPYAGERFNVVRCLTGTFDGNHHTISNFTYRATDRDYAGFFGSILGPQAQVVDLGLLDPNVSVRTGWEAGSLAGRAYLAAGITNCYAKGGRVSGEYYVGGLVGSITATVVKGCHAAVDVVGKERVGGLAGSNESEIADCYASGTVSGGQWVGGLVGFSGSIVDSYASGRVVGDAHVGGLTGSSDKSVSASDSPGMVVGSFWDVETSGQLSSGGGTGKTTREMQTAATFSAWNIWGDDMLWTINDGNDYPRLTWEDRAGQMIKQQTRIPGSGTIDDPYRISTAEGLNTVGLYPPMWGKNFRLTADVDLSAYKGTAFNMIGTEHRPFKGFFDGGYHTIAHLQYSQTIPVNWPYDGPYGLGFFGRVYEPGKIKNVQLVNGDVNVPGGCCVGLLVGFLDDGGRIENCRATGAVSGDWAVGGLVGFVEGVSFVRYCCANVTTIGQQDVGGLVGMNEGEIENCYARGPVTGVANITYDDIGGLVGSNYSWIRNCYATGSVIGHTNVGGFAGSNDDGSIEDSFWDTQTSGRTTAGDSCGLWVVGRTTAQMHAAKTFLDVRWDFVGETANGKEDIWWIDEGKDYPRLSWEAPGEPNSPPDSVNP